MSFMYVVSLFLFYFESASKVTFLYIASGNIIYLINLQNKQGQKFLTKFFMQKEELETHV